MKWKILAGFFVILSTTIAAALIRPCSKSPEKNEKADEDVVDKAPADRQRQRTTTLKAEPDNPFQLPHFYRAKEEKPPTTI